MAKFKRKLAVVSEDTTAEDLEAVDDEVARLEAEVEQVANEYAKQDAAEKKAKKAKDKAKDEFNKLATRLVELTRPLARRTVEATFEDLAHGFGVDEWVAANYPGWRVLDMERDNKMATATIVLEEDPALQKFHVVVGDKVVGRTTSEAADFFDAFGYRQHWLDAGDEATAELLVRRIETVTFELDEDAAQRYLKKNPDERATMQEFVTPGKITLKMNPVRKANEDD